MINGNLLKDFICSKYTLDFLAEKYNLSKTEILSQADKHSKKTKSTSLANIIKSKYKKHLLRAFLSSFQTPENFALEYGLSTTRFLKLIGEIVEDRELIPSDVLADHIYSKAVNGLKICSSRFPERIISIVAKRYAYNKSATQKAIGSIYDVDQKTIANVLKFGIANDIIDDETAEVIFSRVNNAYHVRSKSLIASYEVAFDKRHVTKLKKQLHQMEALMETDDENINYADLADCIEKTKIQIERYSTNP